MSILASNLGGERRAELLALLDTLARDIRLAADNATPEQRKAAGEMAASWAKLVALLDIEPEPELRRCPTCGQSVRAAATRCGYCWSALVPHVSGPHA